MYTETGKEQLLNDCIRASTAMKTVGKINPAIKQKLSTPRIGKHIRVWLYLSLTMPPPDVAPPSQTFAPPPHNVAPPPCSIAPRNVAPQSRNDAPPSPNGAPPPGIVALPVSLLELRLRQTDPLRWCKGTHR